MERTEAPTRRTYIRLDDGRRVLVRRVGPEDTEPLREMHRHLSSRTVHQRFFRQMPELPEDQANRFTHVDGHDRVALVCEDPDGRLVGVARYDRLPEQPGVAEAAFVVADDYQHHHLGTGLVRLLADEAAADGVHGFVADVLSNNTAMIHAFRDAGLTATSTLDCGVLHLTMPLMAQDAGKPAVTAQ